jgi:hypothetical protein
VPDVPWVKSEEICRRKSALSRWRGALLDC